VIVSFCFLFRLEVFLLFRLIYQYSFLHWSKNAFDANIFLAKFVFNQFRILMLLHLRFFLSFYSEMSFISIQFTALFML
jgi:hypothetical protein